MFEETVLLTLLDLVAIEVNIIIFSHCGVFFVHALLGLNINFKEAVDSYRAHIARTSLVPIEMR